MSANSNFPTLIKNKVSTFLKKITSLVVKDEETYADAGAILVATAELKEQIREYWREDKASAHKTWKGICKKESDMLDRVNEIDNVVHPKVAAYLKKLEDERRAQEQKLREEQEAERKRLELQARQAEQKKLNNKVAVIQEKIEQIDSTPITVPPKFDKKLELNGGKSITTKPRNFDFEITNLQALINAIALGTVPLDIINVTIAKVAAKNWVINENLSNDDAIPGLKITETFGVAISTKTKA